MSVIIVGNGPNQTLFKRENFENIKAIIGCNLPIEGLNPDYVVCADAKAISFAYRKTEPTFKNLERYKLVIGGSRAANGIKTVKAVPGGTETVYDAVLPFIHKIIPLWPDATKIGQRYFSSGHYAFSFAVEEFPNEDYHLFGFDSFFTGNSKTLSDELIHKKAIKDYKTNHKEPIDTVSKWYVLWEGLFKKYDGVKIYIHGLKDQTISDVFKKYMEVVNHDIL